VDPVSISNPKTLNTAAGQNSSYAKHAQMQFNFVLVDLDLQVLHFLGLDASYYDVDL